MIISASKNILIYLLLLLLGCQNDRAQMPIDIESFNKNAKENFFRNYETYDLTSMNELEKCVLERAVSNRLDELNDWRLAIIDSFYVRRYHLATLSTFFSFVSTKHGDFYFIALPRLDDYLVHNYACMHPYYDCVEDGSIRLKDSVELSIAKINSSMLDEFLVKEVFHSRPMDLQFKESEKLLSEFFPNMGRDRLSWEMFVEELAKEPEPNRDFITNFFKPIATRRPLITQLRDYRIYKLEPFGWLFLDYYIDETDVGRIALDIYFVAHKQSWRLSYALDNRRDRDCMDLMPLPVPKGPTKYLKVQPNR
jgi:hypothetical protein